MLFIKISFGKKSLREQGISYHCHPLLFLNKYLYKGNNRYAWSMWAIHRHISYCTDGSRSFSDGSASKVQHDKLIIIWSLQIGIKMCWQTFHVMRLLDFIIFSNNLTWRDIQHVIVKTSKPDNLKGGTWNTNGAGKKCTYSCQLFNH